jgi:hypothetical protein
VVNFRRNLLAALAILMCNGTVADVEDDYILKSWREGEVAFPAPPGEGSLREFYVSAAAANRFFVDTATLSIGADGVVRYVLVVLTQGGARNVSFEGMRCETRQWRIYATGRADGSWSKARHENWSPVRDEAVNRYHAALFLDYFCSGGVIVSKIGDLRNAFMRPATLQANP